MKRTNLLLILALVLSLMLALLLPTLSVNVRASPTYTDVGGPIISDTTWTLANSPYVVTSNVQAMTGVTLTIEPGVVVKFNTGRLLQVDGTLIARGIVHSPVTFTSNQPSPQPGDWGNVEFTDSSVDAIFDGDGNYTGGSILQYCVVEYGGSGDTVMGAIETNDASPLVDHCTVRHNSETGIYGGGTASVPIMIRNNTVSDNTVSGNGGGIYARDAMVEGNTVSGNTASYAGGGIYADGDSHSTVTVLGNTVNGNTSDHGGGVYADGSWGGAVAVVSNIVSGNSVGSCGGGIYVWVGVVGGTVEVTGNTVSSNSADGYGGGIYAYGYGSGHVTVTGNIVTGNSVTTTGSHADTCGGGIYAESCTVTGNVVSGNSAAATGYSSDAYGGGIYAAYSDTMSNTVTANSIASTGQYGSGQGSGVYFYYGSYNFLYNTIAGNTTVSPTAIIGGVAIDGTPQFHYNNLYGNSPYDVVVVSSSDISSTNNYWGTVATVDILAHVYDWYDDSSRGRLLYVPYLQDPDPSAPVPPPTNLQANFTDDSANFSWDPIPSTTTGYGHKVYYDNDISGPPYDGTGAAQGNSPIDVGNVTNYTLSGLGGGTYYVAVTAYDTLGRESWYSNETNSLQRVYLPLILKNY